MPRQPLFTRRGYRYVLGLCLLPVAGVGFLAGFGSPFWHRARDATGVIGVHGLWLICHQLSGVLSDCQQTIDLDMGWLAAVQFFQVLALFFLCLACIFAVQLNMGSRQRHSRLLEVFSGLGGLCGLIGGVLYVSQTLEASDSDSPSYEWGLALNLAGSLLAILSAILVASNNTPGEKSFGKGDKQTWGQKYGLRSIKTRKRLHDLRNTFRFSSRRGVGNRGGSWVGYGGRGGVGYGGGTVTGKELAVVGPLPTLSRYDDYRQDPRYKYTDYNYWDRRAWLLPPELRWVSNV